jgi:DNA-binding NarL/FixJ family response regulator
MSSEIRILVVADQLRARKSLKALLSACPMTSEVAEAANKKETLICMETQRPDVVVVDIQGQEDAGLEIVQSVRARWPEIKVLALSLYPHTQPDQLAACADAVISKGEPPARLLNAIAWNASSA